MTTWGRYRVLAGAKGDPGDPGAIGGTYTHVQAQASDTWSIQHDLGYHPSVTVTDSGGQQVIGSVTYTDENSLVVSFTAPFGGYAHLS